MRFLPIGVRVRGQPVLVVGGGEVASRKAAMLARAGARLRVVAPTHDASLQQLASAGAHQLIARPYRSTDLADVVLAVAASDDPRANASVSADARAGGVLVNVVDAPDLCTFVMPALVDRDPLFVAVSTAGASPVLARLTRARIDADLPEGLGTLASMLGQYRPELKARLATVPERRAFWEQVLSGPIPELISAGQADAARAALEAAIAAGVPTSGAAYLVGAGPGDPELLTIKAHRALQTAECVLFEESVPGPVLERARRDATCRRLPAVTQAADLAEELRKIVARGERAAWLCRGGLGAREHALARLLSDSGAAVVTIEGVGATGGATNPGSRNPR